MVHLATASRRSLGCRDAMVRNLPEKRRSDTIMVQRLALMRDNSAHATDAGRCRTRAVR